MRKYLFLIGILVVGSVFAAPPSRQSSYVSQTVIDPSAVTANEDVIFSYLQAGVDTLASNSVGAAAISAGAVGASELASTAVTPGAYTNTNLTVDADGRITDAANGAAAGNPALIEDTATTTKVQTEETGAEAIIRFDIAGAETIVFGDGTNEEMALVTNTGTADALKISQDGVLAASQYGLWLYSNAAQVGASLMFLEMDNAGSDQTTLEIQQDGTGSHIRMTGDPTVGAPVDGDFWWTGTALNFYDGATTTNLLETGSDGVAKAWVNFQGSSSISDSFNVTGVTDNGVGDFTITWDTNFANANYAMVGTCQNQDGGNNHCNVSVKLGVALGVGSATIITSKESGAVVDSNPTMVVAFGDQ